MNTSQNNEHSAVTSGPRQFLKARPLADRLGINPRTLFRWAESGRISKFKIHQRLVVFDVAEVERLIEDSRIGGRN
ncbi:helix-turn-helix transcriptional regulator [Synoicihabitans lomoniglobus]|uniref:Helix-turn-helix domain-containing protein n=1 Tax=Synoicihabitans lomoniglobus TaxID=2909285 RepID=A0AAF0I6C4_9BACT|nr:helix-turn-helix domain-containing protein [Opitutaceae bacterium LMO-M01]WED66016.1 helix-turn-helix domain-containing protein [Opitutaceae bacterium LMO-M01]